MRRTGDYGLRPIRAGAHFGDLRLVETRVGKMMSAQRVCFRLQVKKDRIAEYAKRHTAVWEEMLRALDDTGWRNYSLFLDEDGLLIGYFETENLDGALDGMASREVNARWQSEMAEFFEDLDGTTPDRGFRRLSEVFSLETQISRLSSR